MQKYKDLIVKFSSSTEAIEALVKIGEHCTTPPFSYSEEVEQMYQANDQLNHILVNIDGYPQAVMLVYASGTDIKVLNIVPFKHSCDHIDKDIYNFIIDTFEESIIRPLFPDNKIIVTKDNISISEIIPQSYRALNLWANCPGAPDSPFTHSNDLECWFNFMCTLHQSGEELSSGDLEQWLLEDLQWNEDVVTDAIIRYETERDLLNYYDQHYGRD